MAKFNLGNEVKDKITGFQGIATGHAEYLTGCDQYVVQPKCEKNGTYPDANWFDEGRLEWVSKGIAKEEVKAEKNGSDYRAPIK
tara:strand:+ start:113 stop:364 length:252 start_codon:yes stop_codon:yes gene_type:complete